MCNICGDKTHDDLNDGLDDLFGAPNVVPISEAAAFAAAALKNAVSDPSRSATFEEPCKKCRGSGRFVGYTGRVLGDCFTCKGSGKQVFKTSTESREQKAAAEKARKAAKFKAWTEANDAEWQWLVTATARGFGFASSMIEAVSKYDTLTEKQMAAIHKCMASDIAREQEKADIEARAPDIAGAALDKIETAFAAAIEHGIKYPKMRLDFAIFSAVRSGANAGAIYVKTIEKDEDGERRYLGKIVDGRFVRSFKTTAEEEQRIIAAAMDPAAAAKAYGQRTGTCSICGRALTRNESIDRAMGPICADRYGWT